MKRYVKASVSGIILPLWRQPIRQITWWFMAAILVVLNTPLFPLWFQYPSVMLNSSSTVIYSIGNLPFMCLPLLALIVSPTRSPVQRMRSESAA